MAFSSVEQMHIIGKQESDAVAYTYHDEPEVLHVTHSGDRANHVIVYGPLKLPAVFSDNWDWNDVNTTGQERLAVAVETLAYSAAEAEVRGTLELAREVRFALAVEATVQPNPALEMCDVVEFDDAVLGTTVCRVGELHLTWYPLEGHFDLVVVGGGR